MKNLVVLRLFFEGRLEAVKQFTESQIVIGRNEGLHLTLDKPSVAPIHAVIEKRDSGYYISDLGSEHGVFVNGEKTLDKQIETETEITIGTYKIKFYIGIPKPLNFGAPMVENESINSSENSGPIISDNVSLNTPSEPVPPVNQADTAGSVLEETFIEDEKSSSLVEQLNAEESPAPPEKPSLPEASEIPDATKERSVPDEPLFEKSKSDFHPPASSSESIIAASTAGHFVGNKKGYFAPDSKVKNWRPILQPGKGTVVEVSVAWKERIISSYHFNKKTDVTIGSDPTCDIKLPSLGMGAAKNKLLSVGSVAKLNVTPQMKGVYIHENRNEETFEELFRQNRIVRSGKGSKLDIGLGDMVVLELDGGLVTLYIRYVPESPKIFSAPIFDLTAAEATSVVLALVVSSIFSLYMMVYSPVNLDDEELLEEALVRKAKVTFTIPKVKKRKPPKEEKKPEPKKQVVKIEDKKEPPKPPKKFEITEKKPQAPKKVTKKNPTQKKDPGKRAGVKKADKVTNKKTSVIKKGKSIKTNDKKEGGNIASKKKDVKKVGLLGAFGGGGTQADLATSTDGNGSLVGMARGKTGVAGSTESRDGENLGGKIKKSGGNGGKNLVGIGKIGKIGNGTGDIGIGTGGKLVKGNVQIDVAGSDSDFVTTIDKEAIRRVIRSHKREIRTCYERALNKNKNLYGKLVLKWSIVGRGKATKVKVVKNTLNDKTVANCIKRKLTTWNFPAPPENTEGVVTFPFVFSSN